MLQVIGRSGSRNLSVDDRTKAQTVAAVGTLSWAWFHIGEPAKLPPQINVQQVSMADLPYKSAPAKGYMFKGVLASAVMGC
jgi:hypothetical protein